MGHFAAGDSHAKCVAERDVQPFGRPSPCVAPETTYPIGDAGEGRPSFGIRMVVHTADLVSKYEAGADVGVGMRGCRGHMPEHVTQAQPSGGKLCRPNGWRGPSDTLCHTREEC